jgi:sulfotransferase family protein
MDLRTQPFVRRLPSRARVHAPASPFPTGSTQPVIVHASHHKCGTGWFLGVLRDVGERYGIKLQTRRNHAPIDPSAGIIRNAPANQSLEGLTDFRGSHMIRDPRDVAVSSYHFNLWSDEAWLHEPKQVLAGKTYQEYLNGLDFNEGLRSEILRLSKTVFAHMAAWDYHRPEFLELRYEEVITDQPTWFTRLFRHYGFHDRAVEECLGIAEARSFKKTTGRAMGTVEGRSHLRSGRPGQWRDEFTDDHVAMFKSPGATDLLLQLGYETSRDW